MEREIFINSYEQIVILIAMISLFYYVFIVLLFHRLKIDFKSLKRTDFWLSGILLSLCILFSFSAHIFNKDWLFILSFSSCLLNVFIQISFASNIIDIGIYKVINLNSEQISENRILSRIVSHDLQGAMASIITHIKMLKNKDGNTEHIIRHMESSAMGASNLLINIFFSLTKNSESKNYLVKRHDDFCTLLVRIVGFYSLQTAAKNIKIKIVHPRRTVVFINEVCVEAILRNIVSNSIKFSPERGQILIEYGIISRNLWVTVKDFGIGMNKKQLRAIRKNRKDIESKNGTSGEKGNGLGLGIVSDLVKRCRGKIAYESFPQKGTLVKIEIPIV